MSINVQDLKNLLASKTVWVLFQLQANLVNYWGNM